jgi:hypothetical protein
MWPLYLPMMGDEHGMIIDMGKLKCSEKNLADCYFVHHKSYTGDIHQGGKPTPNSLNYSMS